MENKRGAPTPDKTSAVTAETEAGRASSADHVAVPRLFLPPIGAAVAVQIGTTAAGLGGAGESPRSLIAAGFAVLLAVSTVQLARLHQLNGVWPGGLVGHVVGGTATAASTSYVAGLAAATWAALAGVWWLVPFCAAAGGVAYGLSGLSWMRTHRSEPDTLRRGESAVGLTVFVALSLAGLILLVSLA